MSSRMTGNGITKEFSKFGDSAFYKYKSANVAREAVLFLHGFPGESGKNEDIAENLSETSSLDSFILHYRGLGESEGLFSFRQSLIDSSRFLENLHEHHGYNHIHLIGHSWGGLVALNIALELKDLLGKIILLAPFCLLPDEPIITAILKEFVDSQALKNKEHSLNHLRADYEVIKILHDPLSIAGKLTPISDKFTIIQGDLDEVSTPSGARTLQRALSGDSRLIAVPDDHWFRDRTRLRTLIYNELNRD